MNDEGVAAILGLAIIQAGGEIRVDADTIEAGLPPNSRVHVVTDHEAQQLVITIKDIEEEPVEDGQ